MGIGEFVGLGSRPEAISALADQLERFGAAEGEPEWLVSAIWLCTPHADYLATPSTTVLSDGYIARPLAVDRVDDFVRQMKGDLPDIAARLVARSSDLKLPESARPQAPATLQRCPRVPDSTKVLVHVASRAAAEHRIACGLLFGFEERRLLVGTDMGTLAMVLSEEEELIDRYVARCETVDASEYFDRFPISLPGPRSCSPSGR